MRSPALIVALCVVALSPLVANQNVFVSRFWHNHQPIYWPEWNGNGSQNSRVQYAWDSIVLKGGQTYGTGVAHPDNDLVEIFGKADRVNAYQSGPRNSLNMIPSEAGFAMSYSGSLIDNVRNLAANNQLGYGSGWWNGNREAKNWTTPSGSRRMDLVGFTYHHSLAPLLPKEVFRKELQIFKQAWWKAWGGNSDLSDHSRGFFPTEMAFTTEMVDVLADEGYQWSIVASHHLSRTCPTYNTKANPEGSFNIKSSPPNKADQLGPSPTAGWWFNEPNPGQAAWNVAPFAYQLHKTRYVNPETGAEKSLILVPSDDAQSYVAGYSGAQIGMINNNISPFATDPNRPVIVLPSTDGDNAWGGGSSSYFESTPSFFNACKNTGYRVSSIQDMVNQFGAAAGTIHVEDGAWIFPESDYGSPYFLKWIEPPVAAPGSTTKYPGTVVDLESPGFALKFWAWAPIITGANWVETAEQIHRDEGSSVDAWKIQAPWDWDGTWTGPNVVERAWHIYLAGLDSGFNYYGGLGNDDEVKPSLATRRAIEQLQPWLTTSRQSNDRTGPSILRPQRFPWNPGGYTFGWFNSISGGDTRYLKKMPSDFYIWTHAYDLSGIASISVKVRIDADGSNSLSTNHNETYAGGAGVGAWTTLPMTKRQLPNDRTSLNAAASNGQIDYFITPPELADYYFTKITDSAVTGFRGKLLDYYIEATDTRGNIRKSEIQHVFVEDDGAVVTPPDPPATPTGLSANATSATRIDLAWTPVSGATSYVIKRGGAQVGTSTSASYSDTSVTPATSYSYTVAASNSGGVSTDSQPAFATTPAQSPTFTMDGVADAPGYLLSNPGMTLYAALRGTRLYVATWSPGSNNAGVNDHFIFVTDALLPTASAPAPWGKLGNIASAASKPFLAGESVNTYAGWTNAPASSTAAKSPSSSGQLEGWIDLVETFGAMPSVIHIAATAYQTANGGALAAQAPTGNGDASLDPAEFLTVPVAALRDTLSNGIYDRLDPDRAFRINRLTHAGISGSVLEWPCVPGMTYTVKYSDGLVGSWLTLGTPRTAVSGDDVLSVTDPAASSMDKRFYKITF